MNEILEALRWKKFPVGSDGFVCLVDVMGDDAAIVQAARVSYGNDLRLPEDNPDVLAKLKELYPKGRESNYIKPNDVVTVCGVSGWTSRQVIAAIAACKADVIGSDRTLIRYMMRHNHGTPSEMAEVKLLVRVPMDHWRQWVRHRTFSINEYSTRYTEAIDSAATTKPDEWRLQSTTNRQGSQVGELKWPAGYYVAPINEDGDELYLDCELPEFIVQPGHKRWGVVCVEPAECEARIGIATREYIESIAGEVSEVVCVFDDIEECDVTPQKYLTYIEENGLKSSRDIYEERLKFGIAREQARKDLPLSTYTEAYIKVDLRNMLHFLGLRIDSHAQKEIRDYATIIGEQIIAPLFPLTWEAFKDYQLEAMKLSRLEIEAICRIQSMHGDSIDDVADIFTNKRELDECRVKLERLGLIPTAV